MSYLVLSIIVIVASAIYERLEKTKKVSKGVSILFYLAICLSLCLFAGLRTRYNDTGSYIQNFLNTPKSFSTIFASKFKISEVYLFKIWSYLIYHFISADAHVFLFLSATIFVCPAIYLIKKYSKNFTFSMVLFVFAGMYLFSLAGLKQAMATGIILFGLTHLIRKQHFRYYVYCFLALGFHAYSVFFLILPLLGIEVFNKRTILFCVGILLLGFSLSLFSGVVGAIIEFLGKEVSEETIQSGSVNVVRAVVFMIPLLLSMMGAKKLERATVAEKIFVKVGVLSSIFMVLSLFGNPVLFGRIPQYFIIGIVVSMPLLIKSVFVKSEHVAILLLAAACYIAYGIYGLYNEGAFAKDIFQLIWF